MNREEAKQILLLYRPETADAEDPQVAAALFLVKADAELARWFAEHCERQRILRDKFRQITTPAGLLEQIVSEQAAHEKMAARRKDRITASAAVLTIAVALLVLGSHYWPQFQTWAHPPRQDFSLANYQGQMAAIATSAYGMNYLTNDPGQIRVYLAKNHAPADFALPVPLEKTAVAGCAVEWWNGQKVSLICFRTGQPLPAGQPSDLWLFVVDRSAVEHAPATSQPQFAPAGELFTAAWVQGGKLYLLGTRGDEAALRKFL